MNYLRISLFCVVMALFASALAAQTTVKNKTQTNAPTGSAAVKSSAAFAELLLRKTELLSELESLLVEYNEGFPKIKEIRVENDLLQKEMDKLTAVGPAEAGKLTLALGKLMVRKVEIETDLWSLRQQYNDEHPDVKRARRKAEIYEKAIAEILQAK